MISALDIAKALGNPPPTDEQRAVIEAPLEPVLVVAGAGAGKTETMSGRVVWLVANGLVERENVLGLTFTRKAASELSERVRARLDSLAEYDAHGLLALLPQLAAAGDLDVMAEIAEALKKGELSQGAAAEKREMILRRLAAAHGLPEWVERSQELALRPTIQTYNSFADQLVRENAGLLGRDGDVGVLGETAAWLIMRRIVIRSDDPRLAQSDASLDTIVEASLRIARDTVDNLTTTDHVRSYMGEVLSSIEARPSGKRGGMPADVSAARDKMAALPLLTELADAYRAEKQRRGVIDFADQVADALTLVERFPHVRTAARDRFRVVLLDEYQDTSVAQTKLLSALFQSGAVMAVGDPNQGIYGWRGASANNLDEFGTAFGGPSGSLRYTLLTSWRNDQAILTAANAVLENVTTGHVRVPELRARGHAGPGVVETSFSQSLDSEVAAVAEWFVTERQENPGGTGAILFRSKKHMHRFAEALEERGVPHRIMGLGGLLATPEVVDVVSVLRVLHRSDAGSELIRLLSGPRFEVGLRDLRALRELAARLARSDDSLRALPSETLEVLRRGSSEDDVTIVDALDFVAARRDDEHSWLAAFSPEGIVRLREAGDMLRELRRASTVPLPDMLRMIESRLRLDIELAANPRRGTPRQAAAQLRAFAAEVDAFLRIDPEGSAANLLSWLARAERNDDLIPRSDPPEAGVVQLMTIHASKGLEWDAVAVVRLVESELPGRARDVAGWTGFGVLPAPLRGDADAIPQWRWDEEEAPDLSALSKTLKKFRADNQSHHEAEERRLAYVAVTRARRALLLTGSRWTQNKTPLTASRYLQEMASALHQDLPEGEQWAENPLEGRLSHIQWPRDPLADRRTAVDRAAGAASVVYESAEGIEPLHEIAVLLAERRGSGTNDDDAPLRIPASRFKDFVTDFSGTTARIARPVPERPYRQTHIGTMFHEWVEDRMGAPLTPLDLDAGLWEHDDEFVDESGVSGNDGDERALEKLRTQFLASEWADLRPLDVESEINFVLGEGADARVVICKIDAVYERDGRREIVDWKTGRAPRGESERDERMLQLALYRLAYHRAHGFPLDQIDVALFYVADGLVIRERGDNATYEEEDLIQRWKAARMERA